MVRPSFRLSSIIRDLSISPTMIDIYEGDMLGEKNEYKFDLNDDPAMASAICSLRSAGISFRRPPNSYQIKVGRLNYYPTTGSIVPDGNKALPERGIENFIKIVRSRLSKSHIVSAAPTAASKRTSRIMHQSFLDRHRNNRIG